MVGSTACVDWPIWKVLVAARFVQRCQDTPELYACGVDIVGPSNIKTLLDSIPPYWGPLRNDMLLKIGDASSRQPSLGRD